MSRICTFNLWVLTTWHQHNTQYTKTVSIICIAFNNEFEGKLGCGMCSEHVFGQMWPIQTTTYLIRHGIEYETIEFTYIMDDIFIYVWISLLLLIVTGKF